MFDAKLRNELADTQQQLAAAKQLAKTSYEARVYFENRCRALEAVGQVDEKAKADAEYALLQARKEIASLKAANALITGDSPFIHVGQALHLFSSIHTIVTDEAGKVEAVNGRNCRLETDLSASSLEAVIAARYNRRQATR